jgi:hypothetical protein
VLPGTYGEEDMKKSSAPVHKGLSFKQILAKKSITEMEHPSYSSDLTPGGFWLF